MSNKRTVNGEWFSLEAENALVASLLDGETAIDSFDRISACIKATDFYFDFSRIAFESFSELVRLGKRVDPVMLAAQIRIHDSFNEKVMHSLADASLFPYAIANIEAYANVVLEKSRARQLQSLVAVIAKQLPQVGTTTTMHDVLLSLENLSTAFEERTNFNGLLSNEVDLLAKTVEHLQKVCDGEVVGARTGIDELDKKLGVIPPGDLVVIAGRPSMGKTMLGLNLLHATNVNADHGELSVMFSLEMSEAKLGTRTLSSLASIDHENIRRNNLTEHEWDRLTSAFEKYERSNIRVDCEPNLTPAIMRNKLRALVRKTGKKIRLILVDYLQLMSIDRTSMKRNLENRTNEISEISRSLKAIAKEFGASVVALSQLNRSVESRADKRPLLSDLRDSGAIEQDADIILLLYRDDYYNANSDYRGVAEIIIGKARDSIVGTVFAKFEGQFQRFGNLRPDEYSYESRYGN